MDDTSTLNMDTKQLVKAFEEGKHEVDCLRNRIHELESQLQMLQSLVSSKERALEEDIPVDLKEKNNMEDEASILDQNHTEKTLHKFKSEEKVTWSHRPMKQSPKDYLIKKLKRQYERRCRKRKATLKLFESEVSAGNNCQETNFGNFNNEECQNDNFKYNIAFEKMNDLIDKVCQLDNKCPIELSTSKESCKPIVSIENCLKDPDPNLKNIAEIEDVKKKQLSSSCYIYADSEQSENSKQDEASNSSATVVNKDLPMINNVFESHILKNTESTFCPKIRRKNYKIETLRKTAKSNSFTLEELYVCTEKMCSIIPPLLSPIKSPVHLKEIQSSLAECDSVKKIDCNDNTVTDFVEENKSLERTKNISHHAHQKMNVTNAIKSSASLIASNSEKDNMEKLKPNSVKLDKKDKHKQKDLFSQKGVAKSNNKGVKRKNLSDYVKMINSLSTNDKSIAPLEVSKRRKISPLKNNPRKKKFQINKSEIQKKSKSGEKSYLKPSSNKKLSISTDFKEAALSNKGGNSICQDKDSSDDMECSNGFLGSTDEVTNKNKEKGHSLSNTSLKMDCIDFKVTQPVNQTFENINPSSDIFSCNKLIDEERKIDAVSDTNECDNIKQCGEIFQLNINKDFLLISESENLIKQNNDLSKQFSESPFKYNLSDERDDSDCLIIDTDDETTNEREEGEHSFSGTNLNTPCTVFKNDSQTVNKSYKDISFSSDIFSSVKWTDEKTKEDPVSDINRDNIKPCSDTCKINTDEDLHKISKNTIIIKKCEDFPDRLSQLPSISHLSNNMGYFDLLINTNDKATNKEEKDNSFSSNISNMSYLDFNDLQPENQSYKSLDLNSDSLSTDKWTDKKRKKGTVSEKDKYDNTKPYSDINKIKTDDYFHKIRSKDKNTIEKQDDLSDKLSKLQSKKDLFNYREYSDLVIDIDDEATNKKEKDHSFSGSILNMPYINCSDSQPVNQSFNILDLSSNIFSTNKWTYEKKKGSSVSVINGGDSDKTCLDIFPMNKDEDFISIKREYENCNKQDKDLFEKLSDSYSKTHLSEDMDYSDCLLVDTNVEATIKTEEERHYFSSTALNVSCIDLDDSLPVNHSFESIDPSFDIFSSDKWLNEKKKDIICETNEYFNIKPCSDTFQSNTDKDFHDIKIKDENLILHCDVDLSERSFNLKQEIESPSNDEFINRPNLKDVPLSNKESMELYSGKTILRKDLEILYLSKETYDIMHKSKKLKVVLEDCLKNKLETESSLSKQSCDIFGECKPLKIVLEDCVVVDKKSISVRDLDQKAMEIPDIDDSMPDEITEDVEDTSIMIKTKKFKVGNLRFFRRIKPSSFPHSISKFFFRTLERTIFTKDNFEMRLNTLVNILTDPQNTSSCKDIIFYTVKYLSLTKMNPFLSYNETKNPSLLFPPIEKCIASALLNIDSQSRVNYENFLSTLLLNIRQVIIGVDLPLQGACALCRVLTYICLKTKRPKEPIILCSEILKMRHKYTPMLVVCVAVVWKDLFQSSFKRKWEEIIFFGMVAFVIQQWTVMQPLVNRFNYAQGLRCFEYDICIDLLGSFTSLPKIKPNEEVFENLMASMKNKCTNAKFEEFLFITNAVLFTAFKGWKWAKSNIIEKHILFYLRKYGYIQKNEKAFTFLCKLYAEILLFAPPNYKPETIFLNLFETNGSDTGSNRNIPFPVYITAAVDLEHIKDTSAMCAIHLMLSKDQLLPDSLQAWLKSNENNPKLSDLRYLCHRQILKTKMMDFVKEDLLD